MFKYLLQRLFYAAVSVIAVSVAVFVLTHLIGDPVKVMLPLEASAEQRENMREALGFNDPLYIQFARFSFAALHGDFGNSLWQSSGPATGDRKTARHLPAGFFRYGSRRGRCHSAGCGGGLAPTILA